LGDFILALPGLESLRKIFPLARTIILGYPRILGLVDQRFYADGILSIDQSGMASFFTCGRNLDPTLSQLFDQFDLIVNFGKDGEGALVENLRRVCHGEVLHIHSFPWPDEKVHLADHLLRQFTSFGFPISGLNPRLYLKKIDQDWGTKFWRSRGLTPEERSKVIILHPGSGSKKKVWPPERFLRLAQILKDQFDSRILILFGPAEGKEVEGVFEGMDFKTFVQVKGFSLLELASVMQGCRLFIGNDSGISHLASALEIPTIAIFGPTDPRIWSPRGEKVWVVRREMPCSPCFQKRSIECIDSECLEGIGIEEVLEGLERLGVET
jgi:ADP-heptose:LPS heptosyltransferase